MADTLSCQWETLHSQQLRSIKKSIDSDHGIYRDRRAFITLLGGAAGRGQAEDFRRAPKSGGRPHQRTTGCAWRDMAA